MRMSGMKLAGILAIAGLGLIAKGGEPATAEKISLEAPRFLSAREPAKGQEAIPPERWSASENIRWKTDLPGLGWACPIVAGKRIYLTTCVSAGKVREPQKGLYLNDLNANKYPPDKSRHEWRVYCLDLESGKVLWERTAHAGVPAKPHHIKNTLASETPATDGKRVYALFGNLGLYTYDLDGKLLWKIDIPARETQMAWGTSISPIVHKDRIYLVNDNDEESYLACLDAATGKQLWRVAREEKTNYATPFLWENDQRVELVTSGIGWAQSYDLDGNVLWKLKGRSILAIPTPFAWNGVLYLTSGHVAWGNNPFYAIKAGAKGDISPDEMGRGPLNPSLAWYLPKAGPYHPTPLIVGDILYILYDRGLLAAHDAKTGKEIYQRKRLPVAGFTASPWTYGGKVFCLNEDGVTVAIEAGSTFKVSHRNELDGDDMCMATPVIVGDKLLLRTSARVYCIAKPGPAASGPTVGQRSSP